MGKVSVYTYLDALAASHSIHASIWFKARSNETTFRSLQDASQVYVCNASNIRRILLNATISKEARDRLSLLSTQSLCAKASALNTLGRRPLSTLAADITRV